jgi:GT2 family glycosyltransferase
MTADLCIYGDRFTQGCCHGWQVRCAHPGRAGQVMERDGCRTCDLRRPPGSIVIGAVVTAWNEGAEVRATVESLASSVGTARLRVFLVDDASDDGSCREAGSWGVGRAEVSLLRNETGQGVGRSRNGGAEAALTAGCDVITFHDAHMRFPAGAVEALAARALREPAVVTSAARGWWDADGSAHPFRAWGADLHWNARDGLQPKYRIYCTDRPRWTRVPCPMGACYVMSRETARRLAAPTARLWDDVAGRWGFSEQALALKAYLLGVPVFVARDLATHHRYRSRNPVPSAGTEVWRNCCFATAALLGPETFDVRFRPYCEARLGADQVGALAGEARRGVHRPWTTDEERRVFTHLLGRDAPVTGPHPDHHWMGELEAWLRARSRTKGGTRVLQWRPGESTLAILRALPQARVTCLEWHEHRLQNWAPVLSRFENATLKRVTLDRWCDPVGGGFVGGRDRFDLVTVGGELGEACTRAAQSFLAPGGRVMRNPTADELLVADEFRHEARKAERSRKTVPVRPRGPGYGADLVTVALLNWRRPENIGPLLDALSRQTVRPRVLLWDNGSAAGADLHMRTRLAGLEPITQHDLVDLVVRPSRNLGCLPRWLLAPFVETEYICTVDDDLLPADDRVIEDAVEAHRALCPEGIVGLFGWEGAPGKDYRRGRHVNGPPARGARFENQRVDAVKGRFMLMPVRLLARVPLVHPALADCADRRDMLFRADDLYVSLCVSAGRRGGHLVPAVLARRWRELGRQDRRALAADPEHYALRDRLVRRLTEWHGCRRSPGPVGTGMAAEGNC